MGPFASSHCMKYILVEGYYVLNWVEVVVLSKIEGKSVTAFLRIIFFPYLGLWGYHSDVGSYFCNLLFRALIEKYGVKHKVETHCHPQTSGWVEVPIVKLSSSWQIL